MLIRSCFRSRATVSTGFAAIFVAVLLPFSAHAQYRTFQYDFTQTVDSMTNVGTLDGGNVTMTSTQSQFRGDPLPGNDDWIRYGDPFVFGSLALPRGTTGDFLNLVYRQGDPARNTDTVIFTFAEAVEDPIFYIIGIESAGAQVTVPPGGATFTTNGDGTWLGDVFTGTGEPELGDCSPNVNANAAVQYEGSFPPGATFSFDMNFAQPGQDCGEFVSIGVGLPPLPGLPTMHPTVLWLLLPLMLVVVVRIGGFGERCPRTGHGGA